MLTGFLSLGAAAVLAVFYAGSHTAEGLRWLGLGLLPILVAGTLAAWWRPDHRLAQLLLGFGVLLAAASLPEFVVNIVQDRQGVVGWLWAPVLLFQVIEAATLVVAARLVGLLPDGCVHRRYEALVLRPLWIVPVLPVLGAVTAPTLQLDESSFEAARIPSPLAVHSLFFLGPVLGALAGALPLLFLAAVGLAVLRYRHADVEARLQIKWVLFAVLLLALAGAASVLLRATGLLPASASSSLLSWLLWLPTILVPAAIVVAIVRHRLLDIDVVIRRSLVYSVLWLGTGAIYLGISALFGLASAERVPARVAVLVAVLATIAFEPVRGRLNRRAGRLAFGRRPTRAELLATFGATLEHAFDLGELLPVIATTVRDGIGLEWVRVALELPAGGGRLAEHIAVGVDVDEPAEPALIVPLVVAGERLGVIECGPKQAGHLTDADRELLDTLGRQAALGIHNAHLAVELAARLDEIRRQADELSASRARIVAAQDGERRRIERDIHDGVQQEIVALAAKLRLARNQLGRDHDTAQVTLTSLQADIRRTLDDLRDLAQGIHPSVLTDRGLLDAIEERASRIVLPVVIAADPAMRGARLSADVEAAAYFLVAEGLANILKHARASQAVIRLGLAERQLHVEVSDDGVGFDVSTAGGTGLAGLRDRIEAVGGRLRVRSRSGAGTRLCADLPAVMRSALDA